MDDDCKAQMEEIVTSISKIPGKLDQLICQQKEQNKKLDAIESLLSSIDNYFAGQCE